MTTAGLARVQAIKLRWRAGCNVQGPSGASFREASFIKAGVRYPLCQISPDDMAEIMRDRSKRSVIGYPYCISIVKGRLVIWPRPAERINAEIVL